MIDLAPLYRAIETAPTPADRAALSTMAAFLSRQLEAEAERAKFRKDRRDALIREALPLMDVSTMWGAAVELARRWNRYYTGPEWRADQRGGVPCDAGEMRRVLHGITVAHDRYPLSPEQVRKIGCGHRTPLPA